MDNSFPHILRKYYTCPNISDILLGITGKRVVRFGVFSPKNRNCLNNSFPHILRMYLCFLTCPTANPRLADYRSFSLLIASFSPSHMSEAEWAIRSEFPRFPQYFDFIALKVFTHNDYRFHNTQNSISF